VWEHAVCTILESGIRVLKVAAAFVTERIQRAIAEQAVEILRFISFVTWEEFTILVLEKFIVFGSGINHINLHISLTKITRLWYNFISK